MDVPGQNKSITRFPLIESGAEETSAFVAIIRRLSVARSLVEIMDVVTHAARTLLQADGITFVLREGDLCYYAEEDAISSLWKGRRFPMSACISGWCMLHRQSAVIPDIYVDPRIPVDAYRPTFVKSLVMVPVRQDDPIAAIGAYWANPRNLDRGSVELLQTLANVAALAIASVDLRNSNTDPPWMERAVAFFRGFTKGPTLEGDAPRASKQAARTLLSFRMRPMLALGFALASVLAAAALRSGLGMLFGPDVVPFVTFFPVVLISTVAGGPAAGLVALTASAVIGWWAFVPPWGSFETTNLSSVGSLLLFCLSSLIIIWVANQFVRFAVALEANERERLLLADELRHRVRNTLAVVQAVVRRTLGQDARAATLNRRIAAIAGAADLLNEQSRDAVNLKNIASSEFRMHEDGQVLIEGPDVSLPENRARALSLAFHELATNAAKYGALSHADGRIPIRWALVDDTVWITWTERGGPIVDAPGRSGFGTRFVERILTEAGIGIRTNWDSRGVVHELTLPDSWQTRRDQLLR